MVSHVRSSYYEFLRSVVAGLETNLKPKALKQVKESSSMQILKKSKRKAREEQNDRKVRLVSLKADQTLILCGTV